MNDQKPHLTLSPSFGDADREISTVDSSHAESDGEFEFFVNAGALTDPDPAGEIFSNGWILPVYPVFGRKSDPDPTEFRSGSTSSTSSTSSADSIEIDAGSYCALTPRSAPQSPDRTSKTGGSVSKKWRMRDLMAGRRRSHSDGGDRFGFLANAAVCTKGKKDPKELDMPAVYELFYGNGKGEKKKDGKQRSFLPYRPELVGLFPNSRAHHSRPFSL